MAMIPTWLLWRLLFDSIGLTATIPNRLVSSGDFNSRPVPIDHLRASNKGNTSCVGGVGPSLPGLLRGGDGGASIFGRGAVRRVVVFSPRRKRKPGQAKKSLPGGVEPFFRKVSEAHAAPPLPHSRPGHGTRPKTTPGARSRTTTAA